MLMSLPEEPSDKEVPLRFISAAPIAREAYHRIKARFGVELVVAYGMTEAFPLAAKSLDHPDVPGASGSINPNFEVRIVDDNDDELPAGEVGEIVCRPIGPHVMSDGYFGAEGAMIAQTRGLWFHTGDLGRIDENGCLFFVDRKKDSMRRRGENVSSFEVEQAILTHPAVVEAAAIGVPSDLGEDEIMACLVLRPDAAWDPVPLMEHCSQKLPYFAIPRYVRVMRSLPKNSLGRVTKEDLRRDGVTADTWDCETSGYILER
jgi:crotonobetaine/carnitine-CoA ligase